jgi:hypothetical protein
MWPCRKKDNTQAVWSGFSFSGEGDLVAKFDEKEQ